MIKINMLSAGKMVSADIDGKKKVFVYFGKVRKNFLILRWNLWILWGL